MTVIQKVAQKVDLWKIPIITADHPVYALFKQTQWKFSYDFGEDAFIIMMGGLHIEMVTLHMLGLILLGPNKRLLLTKMDSFSKQRFNQNFIKFFASKLLEPKYYERGKI